LRKQVTRVAVGVRQKVGGCAGLNRHVAGDERALQDRRERLHPDPESYRQRREARLFHGLVQGDIRCQSWE
jgi:hypothetical protein